MGRRYSFELFYPADKIEAGLRATDPYLPTTRRKRTKFRYDPPSYDAPAVLAPLTPNSPIFFQTSLLFPADTYVRTFCSERAERETQWDDEGNEYLPVGAIDVAIRTGERYALFGYSAVTSSMSDLFERSRAIWEQFEKMLRGSGGLVAIFDGAIARGRQAYPVLPDGRKSATFDFFDFVMEERDLYWHLDVDRYAAAVLESVPHDGA